MPRQKPTEWATIGKIVAPFGIRGEVKVFSLSDIPDRFTQLETIFVGSEYEPYTIDSVRPYKGDMVLMRFKGLTDANVAETLRNQDLSIPADQLAQLPPDSYYQHDILGLRVLTMNEQEVGVIVDIMPTGSNDVYVIQGSEGPQVLIPAVKAMIKQIDLIRKIMYIDPIEGLLNENAVIDDPNATSVEEK